MLNDLLEHSHDVPELPKIQSFAAVPQHLMAAAAGNEKGIDIYQRYQTVNSWSQVRDSGVSYCWIKGTDGGGYPVGGRADVYSIGAKNVGIKRSIYHFAQLTPSPEDQADLFVSEVKRLGAYDIDPMLDLEAPFSANSVAESFAKRFISRVKAQGLQCGVYMNDFFANTLKPNEWDIDSLWIARYGSLPTYRPFDVHQYTSDGSIPGISGRVDVNWAYTERYLVTEEKDMELNEVIDLTNDDGSRKWAGLQMGTDQITVGQGIQYAAAGGFRTAEFMKAWVQEIRSDVNALQTVTAAHSAKLEEISVKLDSIATGDLTLAQIIEAVKQALREGTDA